MKRIFSLILVVALLLTAIPWTTPTKVEAATFSRYTVLVLDISGSETFSSNGTTIYEAQTAVQYVREAAVSFLKDVAQANGDNYVAVVTYDEDARVLSQFTNDMDSLTDTVRGISQSSDRDRSVNAGLETAHSLIQGIDDASAAKNVILFTTGMTDAGPHDYEGQYSENTVGSQWYHTGTSIHLYAYANTAYVTAQSLKQDATLYTLGLFQTMEQMPEKGRDVAEFFRLFAKDLASAENCFYDVTDPAQLEFAFDEIAGDIAAVSGTFKFAGQIFGQDDKKDTEAEYWYTDSYFLKRSSLYNPSLATMSLCLELSCWSCHEQTKWYNPKYTPDDPEFWQDKLVNAKRLLLSENLGFSHFAANADWQKDPDTNTIGVCAARKQIDSYRKDEKYTLVAVAVRGGGYGSEWGGNFNIGENSDHEGFALARDKVIQFLQDYLKDMDPSESPNLKLWIVGFSRAGATANMVAGLLNDNPYKLGYELTAENIYCYTFEAPQGVYMTHLTGNYENIHNVINTNDLVPFVAPNSWGFYRYNYQSSRYLPSRYTTNEDTFETQRNAMLVQLDQMGFGEEDMKKAKKDFVYSIPEYAILYQLEIHPTKFLPGGDPLWEWVVLENPSKSTFEMLDQTVDFLAEDLISGRDYYHEEMEASVERILSAFMHYDGFIAGAATEAMKILREFFTVENAMYIVSPMFSLNPFKSFESRLNDVQKRVEEKVKEVFGPYVQQDKNLLAALGNVIGTMFCQIARDLDDGDFSSLENLLNFVSYLIYSEFQAHYPEITLAWCRAEDPNYNSSVSQDRNCAVTRVVRINCPVNVYVYNEDDGLVASIVDDIAAEDSKLMCGINENGEKVVYLPGDSQYHVEIIATAEGTVNYTVSEFNLAHGQMLSSQSYYDIPITEGDRLAATVGAASTESLKANGTQGTDASYELTMYGYTLNPDERILGTDADEKVNVALTVEGNGGYANGAGSYARGSFALLEAMPLSGGQFLGWYLDGELLSEEPVFRFAVRNGANVVARFSEVALYTLKFDATKGGSVQGMDGYYPNGTHISFTAVPEEGYEFVGWQIDGASLDSKNALKSGLTILDEDVTVTAKFRKLDDADSLTMESGTQLLLWGCLALFVLLIGLSIVEKCVKKRN